MTHGSLVWLVSGASTPAVRTTWGVSVMGLSSTVDGSTSAPSGGSLPAPAGSLLLGPEHPVPVRRRRLGSVTAAALGEHGGRSVAGARLEDRQRRVELAARVGSIRALVGAGGLEGGNVVAACAQQLVHTDGLVFSLDGHAIDEPEDEAVAGGLYDPFAREDRDAVVLAQALQARGEVHGVA